MESYAAVITSDVVRVRIAELLLCNEWK